MNFIEHQKAARRRTRVLIMLFGVAVLCICTAVYFVLMWAFFPPVSALGQRTATWNPALFAQVAFGTLCVITAGSVYKILQLASGGAKVAVSLGGRRVIPNTTDADERKLLNIVEEMAIASGIRIPDVYVLDNEDSINAFAAGYSPRDAVIGVTRGAVAQLNRDELQAVVAHEFSHILGGDMRLNIRLIGLLHGILLLAIIGRILLSVNQRPRRRSGKNDGAIPLFIIGLGLLIVGGIGVFFSRIIKSAASRQREFLADASAVQFTRNPAGLSAALRKIGGLAQGSSIQHARAEEASHLYFGDYLQRHWFSLLATHPPLTERIARVEGLPVEAIRPPIEVDGTARNVAGAAFAYQGGPATPVDAVVRMAGECSAERLAYARTLLQSLPVALLSAVHEPMSAYAVVCLLLLSDDPNQNQLQREFLQRRLGAEIRRECERLGPHVGAVISTQRLALADLALPALRGLSLHQYREFRDTVVALSGMDKHCSFFEYAVQWAMVRVLDGYFDNSPKSRVLHYSFAPVAEHVETLLAFVARAGNAEERQALEAYHRGLLRVGIHSDSIGRPAFERLHQALCELEACSPELKQKVVEAVIVCVAHDGVLRVHEIELVRAACDALDYPLPPLLISQDQPRKQ